MAGNRKEFRLVRYHPGIAYGFLYAMSPTVALRRARELLSAGPVDFWPQRVVVERRDACGCWRTFATLNGRNRRRS